jgi:hypothetical protein
MNTLVEQAVEQAGEQAVEHAVEQLEESGDQLVESVEQAVKQQEVDTTSLSNYYNKYLSSQNIDEQKQKRMRTNM